jgi:hypothetical protein
MGRSEGGEAVNWNTGDVIAAGSVALAALAILLNFLDRWHARSESYRAALYASQLSAAVDLLQACGHVNHQALRFIELPSPGSSARDLNEATAKMDTVRSGRLAVLATGVDEAVFAYVSTVLDACHAEAGDKTPDERRSAVQKAWDELVATVRGELGVERLDEVVRDLTGAQPPDAGT